jgi:hypothetical protein
MIAAAVYGLCAATSMSCGWLLLRMYRRSRERLLLWSVLSFSFWGVSNALLFVDFVIVSDRDLSVLRTATALAAVVLQLIGLIWERE